MRDRVAGKPRPIAIFLDELKYHISKPSDGRLGAARDKGVHMLLAHQSIADLKDCPADLNGDAVVGAVVENTKLNWCIAYKIPTPPNGCLKCPAPSWWMTKLAMSNPANAQ
ncbi:type IV secretory system conjugative DNA transfer family protein [Vibrio parahaemolyticus]|uniref:type IV secretory system conjugative DNA transfer family protein n=1 Tax=Vibrio parahaemolyticus TaxID=670 RepID=UPI001F40B574|nr:type IV secretory system conjugative DNA transfer family protein [Vibrio parahaemolyticus]UJW92708.1 hypothetical protein JHS83_24725 [Vibrio parahaemolyticus]WCZ09729.1 hypothetical protein GSR97_26055 [Vibrio parahaemolyticus]